MNWMTSAKNRVKKRSRTFKNNYKVTKQKYDMSSMHESTLPIITEANAIPYHEYTSNINRASQSKDGIVCLSWFIMLCL